MGDGPGTGINEGRTPNDDEAREMLWLKEAIGAGTMSVMFCFLGDPVQSFKKCFGTIIR